MVMRKEACSQRRIKLRGASTGRGEGADKHESPAAGIGALPNLIGTLFG